MGNLVYSIVVSFSLDIFFFLHFFLTERQNTDQQDAFTDRRVTITGKFVQNLHMSMQIISNENVA